MKLPNHHLATIDIKKLRDYCLNPMHPVGRHKARVFKRILGVERKDAKFLRDLILTEISSARTEEVFRDEFGIRYRCEIKIELDTRSAKLVTIWILRWGFIQPALVTCYLKT